MYRFRDVLNNPVYGVLEIVYITHFFHLYDDYGDGVNE